MRPWLTDGNINFITAFHKAAQAHFDKPVQEIGVADQSLDIRRELANAVHGYGKLQRLKLTKQVPERVVFQNADGERVDKSSFAEPGPLHELIAEDLVASLGRAGPGAVSTLAEAMLVVNALAIRHGTDRVYFRGEHNYGWELKTRAQRKIEDESGTPIESADGLTDREIEELRRFQAEAKNSDKWGIETLPSSSLPDDNDPEWLPIMQHYDQSFGTRLLDISSSIFTGLHFACVDWDGSIDFETDGLLYVFFDHGRYYQYEPTGGSDDEISEFVPANVEDSFKGWGHPEYFHHYRSAQYSAREFAQDGRFLVQGDLGLEPVFGGGAKFKLCVPHWAKGRIIKELWLAGYTPERIVRGNLGEQAAEKAKGLLEDQNQVLPSW